MKTQWNHHLASVIAASILLPGLVAWHAARAGSHDVIRIVSPTIHDSTPLHLARRPGEGSVRLKPANNNRQVDDTDDVPSSAESPARDIQPATPYQRPGHGVRQRGETRSHVTNEPGEHTQQDAQSRSHQHPGEGVHRRDKHHDRPSRQQAQPAVPANQSSEPETGAAAHRREAEQQTRTTNSESPNVEVPETAEASPAKPRDAKPATPFRRPGHGTRH